MVGQYLPQTNEKCYSVLQCVTVIDVTFFPFSPHLNTAFVCFAGVESDGLTRQGVLDKIRAPWTPVSLEFWLRLHLTCTRLVFLLNKNVGMCLGVRAGTWVALFLDELQWDHLTRPKAWHGTKYFGLWRHSTSIVPWLESQHDELYGTAYILDCALAATVRKLSVSVVLLW